MVELPTKHRKPTGLNPMRVLRFNDYRFVWSSEALSLWAVEMEIIVLAIFVLQDTGSPLLVGLIGALKFAGTMLGPFYGLMVDRFDPKRLQVAVRAVGLILALTLTTLVVTNTLELWHAYVIVTTGSMIRMLDLVLIQTLTADAVPSESLHNAIGLSRSTLDGARVVGALLGGTIFEVIGLDFAYITISVLYLLATVAALKVKNRPPAKNIQPQGIKSGLIEGIKYICNSKFLPGLIFFSFLIEFSAFPIVNGLMTIIGDELYGFSGTGIGILASITSLGALSGAIYLGIRTKLDNPTRTLIIGSTIWHVIMLALACAPSIWIFGLLLFLWGLSGGITFVAMIVGLLRATEDTNRGRVMGIRSLGIYGLPLGLMLGGWIAEEYNSTAMIGTLGIIGLLATVFAYLKWPDLMSKNIKSINKRS